MLADYLARYAFTTSPDFVNRIQVAITIEAVAAMQDTANPNYVKRKALAASILTAPVQYAGAFGFAVMADLGFDDSSTDAGLQLEVHNRYDNIAGV